MIGACTCPRCKAAPTLTPKLSLCRECLRKQVDADREHRLAAQRLAMERAREARAGRWQRPLDTEDAPH